MEWPKELSILSFLMIIIFIGQIANAYLSITRAKKELNSPMDKVRASVESVKKDVAKNSADIATMRKDIDIAFDNERRIEAISKLHSRSLLALTNHDLTGNNQEELETVRADLYESVFGKTDSSNNKN